MSTGTVGRAAETQNVMLLERRGDVSESKYCVLCDLYQNDCYEQIAASFHTVECPKCGLAMVHENAAGLIKHKKLPVYQLMGFVRYNQVQHGKKVTITEENINYILNDPIIPLDVNSKFERLLVNMSSLVSHAGEKLRLEYQKDFPLAFCKNVDEFRYVLSELRSLGYISFQADSSSTLACGITAEGWQKISHLSEKNIDSKQCFIAMAFSDKMEHIYGKAIHEAVTSTGYSPYRIDKEEHVELIPYKMLSEIKKSKFVIADFTYQRGGVYFEAGYAMGQNLPVIWICDEEDFENAHFDIKQYNHIIYTDEHDLLEKLVVRIEAIIT